MGMAGHVQDTHATEKGAEAEISWRYMSYHSTHSVSAPWFPKGREKTSQERVKGPHRRYVNNIKISTRCLRDNSSVHFCLCSMANVALKRAETQRLSVEFRPKGDCNLTSVTCTQEKSSASVRIKALTLGLPPSVSQNESCI